MKMFKNVAASLLISVLSIIIIPAVTEGYEGPFEAALVLHLQASYTPYSVATRDFNTDGYIDVVTVGTEYSDYYGYSGYI